MNTTQNVPAELVSIDPRELVIGANARIDVKIDAELVASIAEQGVLQAITATRDEEGRVVVLMGQRRTRAAIEAGLATVPVMIVPAAADDVERIVSQVEENDRRAAMSNIDRVAVAEQLALMGLSASQIAKRTRRERAEVDAALAVAGSASASQRLADEGLSLEDAAALAEFEGDEEATSRIENAIRNSWQSVAHVAAQIRRDRAAAELIAQRRAELEAEGLRVIERPESWPGYGARPASVALAELVDKQGKGWGERMEAHREVCTGHVVWLDSDGESVRETVGCEDYRSHGHKTYNPFAGTGSRQSAEERRAVIDGNRAWLAAADVRGEFVRGLAKAAKAPKGAEQYVTKACAFGRMGNAHQWYELRGQKMPTTGYGTTDWEAVGRSLARLSAAKLTCAQLTMALGYMEAKTSEKGQWRALDTSVAEYLNALAGWGYSLSDAEATYCQKVADAITKRQADEKQRAERLAKAKEQTTAQPAPEKDTEPEQDTEPGDDTEE